MTATAATDPHPRGPAVFLYRCRKCRDYTPVTDDADRRVRCVGCGRELDPRLADVIDDPVKVRRRLLESLIPLANALVAFGLCQLSLSLALVLMIFAGITRSPADALQILCVAGVSLLGGLIALGGRLIRRGRMRPVCMVACGLTAFSPLVVGLPLGAWGVWKLTRPEVKTLFDSR